MTREYVRPAEVSAKEGDKKYGFVDNIKDFCKNKYFILSLVIIVMQNLSLNINSGSQTYFYKYAMEDEMLMTSLNLVNLVPMVLSVMFLAGPCLRIFGKKKSIYIGAVGAVAGFALRGFAGMTMNLPLLYAGTIIGALTTGPLSIPINTLVADAVDYGEYLTNRRIEGTCSAIITFAQKISSGVASGLVGWTLALTGFVANAVQDAAARQGILFLFAWFPIILTIVIMVLFHCFYKYDQEVDKVLEELERRKNHV